MMAVTELALLHLKNNEGIDSPKNETARAKLMSAIKAQASYASFPVFLLTQVEDPSHLYLLGGWESVETHMEKWIPSKMNQDLLAKLGEDMEVVWLRHLDISPVSQSSLPGNNEHGSSPMPLTAPVIAISRYFIEFDKKDDFLYVYSASKHHFDSVTKPWTVAGGWRVDGRTREEENSAKDEFVLFSGWVTAESHLKFAESKDFKDSAKIKEFLESTEIKHAVLSATS